MPYLNILLTILSCSVVIKLVIPLIVLAVFTYLYFIKGGGGMDFGATMNQVSAFFANIGEYVKGFFN